MLNLRTPVSTRNRVRYSDGAMKGLNPSRSPNENHKLNSRLRCQSFSQEGDEAAVLGREKLKEITKRMPEECFELSLTDLVDPSLVESNHGIFIRSTGQEKDNLKSDEKVEVRRRGRWFFRRKVLPISLWWSRRKEGMDRNKRDGKISPKPLRSDSEIKSQHDRSKSNSANSSWRHGGDGCWSFFLNKKDRSKLNADHFLVNGV